MPRYGELFIQVSFTWQGLCSMPCSKNGWRIRVIPASSEYYPHKGKANRPDRLNQSSFPVKSIQNPPFSRRDEPIVYEPRTIMVFAISKSS